MNNDNKIRNEITRLARQMSAKREVSVYLYGSRARGNARPDSDWDLLIILEQNHTPGNEFDRYALPFAEIGWQYGSQITPLLYSRNEWDAERNTAFHLSVETEAIPL